MSEFTSSPFLGKEVCFGCSTDTSDVRIGSLRMCRKCHTEAVEKNPRFWGKK